MKKGLKNKVASIAMACLMAVSATVGVASATTKYNVIDRGDKWKYGNSWGTFYSDYYNPKRWHWSYVKNNWTGQQSTATASSRQTSHAVVDANWIFSGTAKRGVN